MQILKRASGSACTMRAGMCQMSWCRMGGWKENEVGKRGDRGWGAECEQRRATTEREEEKDVKVKSKQQIFLVNSPVSDPVDLTLRHQTDRTGMGRPLALACHSSESTRSPLHLSHSLLRLFSLFMFHHKAYQSPLSLIEECPGWEDILCFIVALKYGTLDSEPGFLCRQKWEKKGALCSFRQDIYDFNISDINEVIIQTKKYSFFP